MPQLQLQFTVPNVTQNNQKTVKLCYTMQIQKQKHLITYRNRQRMYAHKPRKSKVSNFDDVFVSDETVACGKITVNEALLFEIFHRRADLITHLNKHVSVGEQARLVSTQILQQGSCNYTQSSVVMSMSILNLYSSSSWKPLMCSCANRTKKQSF